jgi:hypothetical protein
MLLLLNRGDRREALSKDDEDRERLKGRLEQPYANNKGEVEVLRHEFR